MAQIGTATIRCSSLAAVATERRLKPEDLTGRSRNMVPLARVARQCAMLLCRDRTLLTLREVGDLFGGESEDPAPGGGGHQDE